MIRSLNIEMKAHAPFTRLFLGLVAGLVASLIVGMTFDMPSADANQCDNGFINIPGDRKIPAGRLEVVLQPGDTVWHMYQCKQCDNLASMRPNSNGRQQCPSCGKPHSKDNQAEPRILPEHFTDSDGRIHLIYTESLIRSGDGTKKYADSGAHWTCSYCDSSAFQIMASCPGCGAGKPTLMTPGRFKNYAEANPADPVTGVPLSTGSTAASHAMAMASAAVAQGKPITSARGIGPVRSVSLQQSSRPSFLRTRGGMMLVSAAATGALGFVWWGTQSYTLPATVTRLDGDTAYISYTDTDGEEVTLDFTAMTGEPGKVRKWRVGDSLTLHFRNLGGLKGGEAFDGTLVKQGSN